MGGNLRDSKMTLSFEISISQTIVLQMWDKSLFHKRVDPKMPGDLHMAGLFVNLSKIVSPHVQS